MSPSSRLFADPFGNLYVARLTPHERSGALGVSPDLNAVVIETCGGRWMGAVGIHGTVCLEELSHQDMLRLLVQAVKSEAT